MNNYIEQLIQDLSQSKSQYHSINTIKERLLENGFIELYEDESFNLEKGKKYFLIRNLTSLIAFKLPIEGGDSFKVAATHSDSPTFKLKSNPISIRSGAISLIVEPYGGAIYPSWIDRPLSIAGRVVTSEGDKLVSHLVDIDEDLLIIPSLCIHFNRDVNKGHEYNPAVDILPIMGVNKEINFKNFLKEKCGLDGEILSHDLYLYNRDKPRLLGIDKELLSSPKEDDLASAFTVLYGFIESEPSKNIDVYCCFDNEEVGSLTRQGADSDFLRHTLSRIAKALGKEYEAMTSSSYLLSVDNAHAVHPSFPNVSEPEMPVHLNEGIVIKYNANQSYTSDGLSSSLVKKICMEEDMPYQEFANKSDVRGGSTLGNLSEAQVSMLACDIGIAQWAMHSSNETLGSIDVERMAKFAKAYYGRTFSVKGGEIIFA